MIYGVKKEIFTEGRVSAAQWIVVVLTAYLFSFNGCATIPKEETSREALKAVAERYWNMRMENKYEDAYKREDREGLPPFEEYRDKVTAMTKLRTASFTIKEVGVQDEKGAVTVEFSLLFPKIPNPVPRIITDQWVYKDGRWWHRFSSRWG